MPETVYQAPSISLEEYERYRGRHVALYDGRIIAARASGILNCLKRT
jgi:hypothetical protein